MEYDFKEINEFNFNCYCLAVKYNLTMQDVSERYREFESIKSYTEKECWDLTDASFINQ